MSRLYGDIHRAMQMAFDTRTLADRLEGMIVKPEIDDVGKVFIASRDMFFLTTIDHNGRPTVSYKGGSPGFVRVLDASTLLFPSYDGNGMYLSMGNISGNPEIGMLFIDFEKPFRLRAQGRAELIVSGPELRIQGRRDGGQGDHSRNVDELPALRPSVQEARNVALRAGRRS